MHPIVLIAASRARPEVSFSIAPDPIAPSGSHIIKYPSIGKPGAVDDIEDINIVWLARFFCRIHKIEFLEIRGETNPIGLLDVLISYGRLASGGIKPIGSCRKFEGLPVTLVPGRDAISRIGEPDMPVRMGHNIVRRVYAFALKSIHQHCNRSVRFRSR